MPNKTTALWIDEIKVRFVFGMFFNFNLPNKDHFFPLFTGNKTQRVLSVGFANDPEGQA
ncbi:hypothetical protein SC1083_0944 [Aggregatibacter actinomycetemcomitans serotype e str. SC1083]|uniref:Uncharacterized protein n=1 Tax=Aggregatibacter actinomycetemcomitans serotype e str. SC1083 TaxID=907488 RepID=G4A7Z8_AGGAC|nr:hypothetical protein SC1083_0944 [Aggregatibacter actinomycetemcomitans serotype e str. SC1083]KYK76876.1 hypothetical protein SA3096_00365 [Aggregatibacter actinomycetemcomitans serotype e str. SA3096]KYK77863.1 hypothetical protein SC936_10165 [Aggregatibacter actinomycetemcomitans serotype e str. SC936]KYK94897.1 hypothetical protein ANH9776_06025 [Aggregatibacter actinomycetemcomitans serotype e str. ANH9776]MBN6075461.1 hypothetical protein [Aggregatibacter actinomycetemcomitans]